MVFLSFAGAKWAYEATLSEGKLDWELKSGPGPGLWESALRLQGLTKITLESDLLLRARALPSDAGGTALVWGQRASRCVAVYRIRTDLRPEFLFCPAGPSHSQGAWIPLGSGWKGFESALLAVQLPVQQSQTSAPRSRKSLSIDPREVRY